MLVGGGSGNYAAKCVLRIIKIKSLAIASGSEDIFLLNT